MAKHFYFFFFAIMCRVNFKFHTKSHKGNFNIMRYSRYCNPEQLIFEIRNKKFEKFKKLLVMFLTQHKAEPGC